MDENNLKLFVGGLNINTTTASFREYFTQFGTVRDAIVITNPQTQKSKCFGFVTFEDADVVEKVQQNRPHIIDDKEVETKRVIPRSDPNPESRVSCKKIFIGGIKRDITQDELRDYFEQFGTTAEVQLCLDKITGESRGFAFVTFEDSDSVDKAVIKKDHCIAGRSRADVKKALSRDEMNTMNTRKQAYQQPNPYYQNNYSGSEQWGNYYNQGGAASQWNGAAGYGQAAGGAYGGAYDPSAAAAAYGQAAAWNAYSGNVAASQAAAYGSYAAAAPGGGYGGTNPYQTAYAQPQGDVDGVGGPMRGGQPAYGGAGQQNYRAAPYAGAK